MHRSSIPWSLLLLTLVAACDERADSSGSDEGSDASADAADVTPDTDSVDTGSDDTPSDAATDAGSDTRLPDVADTEGSDAGSDGDATTEVPGPDDPTVEVLEALRDGSARPPTFVIEAGFPTSVAGSWPAEGDNPVDKARAFLTEWDELYRLDDEKIELRVGRVEGEGDEQMVSFIQTFSGLPVHRGNLVVELDGDGVFVVSGRMIPREHEVPTQPAIGPEDAVARARVLAGLPIAQLTGEVRLVIVDTGMGTAGSPIAPRLAWRVSLGSTIVLIDALDASLIDTEPMEVDDFDLDLEDSNYADRSKCWTDTTEDDQAADEDEIYDDWVSDPEVNSFWNLTRQAYNYYFNAFGLDSYDNDAEQWEVYVHVDSGSAYYSFSCDLFAFPDARRGGFDTVLHEYTHAIIHLTSNLVYQDEPGALNESYADVMAAFGDEDWLQGNETVSGIIRDLETPADYGQPSHYVNYVVTDADDGGVHTNSGIMNRAAFLITDGGAGPDRNVIGIGRAKAQQLYYATFRALPTNATFFMAANATISRAASWAATGKHGFTAGDLCNVRNGFQSVGVASGDLDCDGTADISDIDDDSDGVYDQFDNCPGRANPSQKNTDWDLLGDACDPDIDNDGVTNDIDNCDLPNADQNDVNGDGVGDKCVDFDEDGVLDGTDNCRFDSNTAQIDTDDDGDGDACDPDSDMDGWSNDNDNCPFDANPDQADSDDDVTGDVCDRCPEDADNVTAWSMGYPELGIDPKPIQPDADGDGTPDACDNAPFGGIGVSRGTQPMRPGEPIGLPDGTTARVSVTATAGDVISFPLPQCVTCPEWFEPGDGIDLSISNLPDTAIVWIADEYGGMRSRSRRVPFVAGPTPPRTLGTPAYGEGNLRMYLEFTEGFSGATTFSVTGNTR